MNRVTAHTGSKYPIIQAPMGWIARSQLASAVCEAGGMGIIETSSGEIDNCKKEIQLMSDLTDKPFGVNLPLLFLKDDSMVNFCVDAGVRFVTTSAGDPTKYIRVLKDAGITVYHAVPSLDGALKAANAGVDGLVVEGTEGGGFKSPVEVGLLVLIQSIKQNIDIPIIAAGGIVDELVWLQFLQLVLRYSMGTRFVSSLESPVHDNFKNKIVESGIDGTYILNKQSKPVIRALKSNLTDKINDSGQMDMSALMNIKDLYFDGDMEAAPALSGQSIGLINEVKSVKQIVDEIINEFNNTCESLGNIRF